MTCKSIVLSTIKRQAQISLGTSMYYEKSSFSKTRLRNRYKVTKFYQIIVFKIKRKPIRMITSYCRKNFKEIRHVSKEIFDVLYSHDYQPE